MCRPTAGRNRRNHHSLRRRLSLSPAIAAGRARSKSRARRNHRKRSSLEASLEAGTAAEMFRRIQARNLHSLRRRRSPRDHCAASSGTGIRIRLRLKTRTRGPRRPFISRRRRSSRRITPGRGNGSSNMNRYIRERLRKGGRVEAGRVVVAIDHRGGEPGGTTRDTKPDLVDFFKA